MTDDAYQRLQARYERMLEISRQLNSSRDLTAILNVILDAASELTATEAVSIMLLDPDSRELHFVASHDVRKARRNVLSETFVIPLEASIAGWVVTYGQPQLVADTRSDPRFFDGVDKQTQQTTRNLMAVPLKAQDAVIGVVEALNKPDDNPWTEEDQQLLIALANQSAIAIQTARYIEAQITQQRIERELAIAQRIQQNFIPSALPQPPGWEIAAHFKPAREVSGDFYDMFEMPDGHIGFVIADVCDKGIGAALFMSLSRSLLRAFSQIEDLCACAPGNSTATFPAVQLTNDYIATNHGDMAMFVTLFFGALNPATGHLFYINGGHNPPAIVGKNGIIKQRLDRTGPAVGVIQDAQYGIERVTLQPGDTLVMFTDGVPDARNVAKKSFGENQLMALLARPELTAAAVLKRIVDTVTDHIGGASQFDDTTLMAVRRLA